MKSGLQESLKELNKKKIQEVDTSGAGEFSLNIPEPKLKVQAAFTISSEIYNSINQLAKKNKITKTTIVNSIFDAVYQNGQFNINIEKKEEENKNLLNIKIDKDLNKSLKKLSKDTNKSLGELFEDIFNTIKKN